MNIVCIGAHPDDAEVFAGGVMTLFARAGHHVLAVSLTNGDAGHHEVSGEPLAGRRIAEARLAAERGGYDSLVLDNHDGELIADLRLRKEVVRIIREHRADIVFTHRPNDYHPDHRYAALAVQDAAFMVTVPRYCPETPALPDNPLFLYFFDEFEQPAPFQADVAIVVDDVMDVKWRLLDAMASQFYEWLPWLDGNTGQAPPADAGDAARLAWLEACYGPLLERPAERHLDALLEWRRPEAESVRFVEVFQICEYGRRPDKETLKRMFCFSHIKTGA